MITSAYILPVYASQTLGCVGRKLKTTLTIKSPGISSFQTKTFKSHDGMRTVLVTE